MLPRSAVRGGTGLKIRFGDKETRGSRDLDVALSADRKDFLAELEGNLAIGWNGFTGQLLPSRRESDPPGIPAEYVMVTREVKLTFRGSEWVRQEIDLGHDEIGDTSEVDLEMSEEIISWFENVGLPRPGPIPVVKVHHQIAQKIHALASNPTERTHDLVDLQVIFQKYPVDQMKTSHTCKRLFKSRGTIDWPPALQLLADSEITYVNSVEETSVLPEISDAVKWFNDVITWLNTDN